MPCVPLQRPSSLLESLHHHVGITRLLDIDLIWPWLAHTRRTLRGSEGAAASRIPAWWWKRVTFLHYG